jgi:hypothetical protein
VGRRSSREATPCSPSSTAGRLGAGPRTTRWHRPRCWGRSDALHHRGSGTRPSCGCCGTPRRSAPPGGRALRAQRNKVAVTLKRRNARSCRRHHWKRTKKPPMRRLVCAGFVPSMCSLDELISSVRDHKLHDPFDGRRAALEDHAIQQGRTMGHHKDADQLIDK